MLTNGNREELSLMVMLHTAGEIDLPSEARSPKFRSPANGALYVAGRAGPLWMPYVVSLVVGGGLAIVVLLEIPLIVGELTNSDDMRMWLGNAGTQLPGPYLALLGLFGAFLAVWQLENAAQRSGEATIATVGAAFVLRLSSAVAAAPEPNALMQLRAAEDSIDRDQELLRLSEASSGPPPQVARDRLALRLVLMLLVLPATLGSLGEMGLYKGIGPAATGVSLVLAVTSTFGILYVRAQSAGLRGPGTGVPWSG
jgi:hypothetical protein